MTESHPYFAVNSSLSSYHQSFGYGAGCQPPAFPVVRLRGLPFNCTDIDVNNFFTGLDIVGILLVNKNGRFSGKACVLFAGNMHVECALHRDRQNMVRLFRCNRQDYYNAVAAEVNCKGTYDVDCENSPSPTPSRPKGFEDKDQMEFTEILKMRGLPFTISRPQTLEFFKVYEVIQERSLISCCPNGKVTGEAFVEFVSSEEARRAMAQDKMTIGSRFVELFPATRDKARRAESRSRQ